MYRNSHHIARNIRLNVKQIVKTVEAIISFGIDGRQWVASAIICAMIWPLFVLPTAAFGASGVNSTTAEFEPVNEQLPIWTRAWRDLSADIETRLIALRPANLINKASDDNDKKKKSVKPDEHAVKPEDAKPALTDPKPHNKAADDPDSSPVMKEGLPKPHLVAPAAAPAPMAFMSQLSPGEHDSIYNYQNNLGSPKGQVEMDSANRAAALPIKHRVGIADFSFGLPLASIPGRGIDAGVGMTYNSRTWNKSCEAYTGSNCTTDHYTYDVEQSWIAPGFSSGFGYLDTVAVTRSIHIMNTSNIYYYTEIVPAGIIDSDGTRHQFECAAGTSNNDNFVCNTYRSTDGSFISIPAGTWLANINNSQTPNTAGYAAMNFVANYPNGSKVWYAGAFGSDNIRKHYPIVIQDNNGNRVRVAYKADQSGRIDYITDTVNRKIKFYYENDGNGNPDKLVAVTIPGTGTNDEIQTVRFYYETLTLSSSGKFVGTITAPSTIRVLSRVYVPGTKTLFKYEYDTNFGMIKKITRYVGAIATSTGLTATGSITSDGLWATSTEYNYPDGSTALTDVPKYTTRTDNWQNSGGAQVTDYGSEVPSGNNGNQYISTVTTHDNGFNVVNKTISGSDGMIKETSTSQTSTGGQLQQLMSKTAYTWSSDGKRNLTNIEVTNDAGLTKVTVFGYDRYNNQTAMRECDYGVTVANCTETNALRRTVTSYETNSGWIDRNLVGLPTSSTTIVGGVNVSKTLIEYDHSGSDTTITKRTDIDINTHDTFYNPDHAAWDETICADGLGYSQSALPDGCVVIHHPGYTSASAYRGNATKVTRFSDATLTTDTNADVTEYNHDITGNLVSATLSCCNLKTIEYGADFATTGYAYPTSETKGSSPQLTTSATYNLNTGLVLTTTNENSQTTHYDYETDTLRPQKTTYPNGGYVETDYSDKLITDVNDLLPGFTRQTTTLDSTHTVQSYGYYDARGLRIRSASETPDGWLISAVEYDSLGRVKKSYNPFYGSAATTAPGATAYSEVTSHDGFGRTLGMTLQDGTTVSTHFGGSASGDIPSGFNKTWVSVTDQAGKKRRQVADSLGRIVRVDEPDANGSLGAVDATLPVQQTSYEYDGNDNLSKVTQSDGTTTQERKFMYDSLSRLKAERQVEADATLDLDGTHGTASSTKWTKVLKYNAHGLLTDGYDARGVRTQFAYDGLNRISTVTYSGETGYQTPAVTYTYDQARSTFFNTGALTKVETASSGDGPATKTEFDYDVMGRVSKHRQWIGTQQYDLEYGYNLAGQMTSEKYPSGRIVTNSYDAKGRLSGIADGSRTYLSGLVYQGKGGSISAMNFGNGTAETFGLNDRFQIETQELKKGSATLQKYNYNYGQIDVSNGNIAANSNNGQLAKVESWIGTAKQWEQRFGYDSIGRLKESREIRGDNGSLTYKQTFDFDRFGNMYRKTANNNPSGQSNPLAYTPIEDADITKSTNRLATNTTYDEAGNVVTDNKFRTMGFNYDANGRMVKATKANSPDALSVYDAAGMRVAEKVNDIWRFLIYDIGGKLVSEYGGLNSNDEGGVKYLLSDWQGSTRAVLSNSGTINSRSDYTAFGEEIAAGTGLRTTTQGFGTTNSTRQKYGLTERDDATGLDHTWFRKHENRAGRWTGPDPYNGSMSLGNPQSFNRFGYVENQPTNFTDPSGLLIGYCFRTCVRVENDDGTWGPYECETHCTLVDIGNGPVWPTVGTTDIAGGGGPDQITPKIPTRESHCRSLSKAIRSHVKQAQRHLNNYGNDFSKWVANDFPYNPLTGQLRDYQNHVYQADKLTNQYNAECDDQEPPPPVPVFARVPSELLNWKPFLNRLWDLLPSAPTKKQVDQWYPSPWGPVPMPGRRIPIPIPF